MLPALSALNTLNTLNTLPLPWSRLFPGVTTTRL